MMAAAVAAVLGLILVWALNSSSGDKEAKPEPTAASNQTSGPTPKSTPTTAPPTQVTAKPVGKNPDLDSPVKLSDGATAKIVKIEKVQSQGELPGEISAPALRFTVETTAGSEALNLATVVVNAYYGPEKIPAVSISGPGGKPFGGSLASGKTAKGVYIFNIPVAERDNVSVEFNWSPKAKPVILSGNVS